VSRSTRARSTVALAVSFAVSVGMTVALAGRLHAAALTTTMAAGALVASLVAAGRPLSAVRLMGPRERLVAAAGGLLAFLAAPAVITAVRMSDAPAGSVVVFWMAGGWAFIAAVSLAVAALVARDRARALWALAGGTAALVGVAAVVANWERPSSFSPLVRFPVQEVAILAAGALFLAGGLLLARAARDGRAGGPLVCGASAALLAGAVWWLATDATAGLRSLGELPVQVALAALAWGVACVSFTVALRSSGQGRAAAMLALAPLLLSALTWLEQAVGAAGPQPFIASGVLAGGLVLASGALALWRAGAPASSGVRMPQPLRWLAALAAVPVVLAAIGLGLPSILVRVVVTGAGAPFSGSWAMPGYESLAGLGALALALVLGAVATSDTPAWAVSATGAAACLAWPLLEAVPTHVLTGGLSPAIQQYYGTEYGSITFASVQNVPTMLAVGVTGLGLLAALVVRALSARRREPIS
jgi:hypothetical protein